MHTGYYTGQNFDHRLLIDCFSWWLLLVKFLLVIAVISARASKPLMANHNTLVIDKEWTSGLHLTPPSRVTALSAGLDLWPCKPYTLQPGDVTKVETGWRIKIPDGHVGLIKGRSSIAAERHLQVLAGVIDPDFLGYVKILLHNMGPISQHVSTEQPIAQLLVIPVILPEVQVNPAVFTMSSQRKDMGFGEADKSFRYMEDKNFSSNFGFKDTVVRSPSIPISALPVQHKNHTNQDLSTSDSSQKHPKVYDLTKPPKKPKRMFQKVKTNEDPWFAENANQSNNHFDCFSISEAPQTSVAISCNKSELMPKVESIPPVPILVRYFEEKATLKP